MFVHFSPLFNTALYEHTTNISLFFNQWTFGYIPVFATSNIYRILPRLHALKFLVYRVSTSSTLQDRAILFSKWLCHVTFLPVIFIYESTLLHIIVSTWDYQTLNFGQSNAYTVASHCRFKLYLYLHFLDQTTFYEFSNNSFFLYMKFFISVICPFFYWNVCFFLLICVLYIFWVLIL